VSEAPQTRSAPLLSIPEAPAPADGVAEWFDTEDGVRLRTALFRPQGPARGSVILSQGRAEFIEKYFEVIDELLERGFVVFAHDWRGQGLSGRAPPARMWGHARGWRPFISDYTALLAAFEDRLPKPWIAVGHSMGGGLTTLALAEGEARVSAAVLSAPMMCVATGHRSLASVKRLSYLMNLAGRARELVLPPPDPHEETFENNILTHDRVRWARTTLQGATDPDLKEGGVTWGWLAFALILHSRIKASLRLAKLPIPFVVVAAEEEKLVVNAASRAVADKAPYGRYVEIAGAYHEILMETDERRAVFWDAFDTVAEAVAPASPPRSEVPIPAGVGRI
jgi:lysophospholipase